MNKHQEQDIAYITTTTKNIKTEKYLGLVIVIAVVSTYTLILFNKFFPIEEGWFSVFAHEMAIGKTPYKDFFFFLQPLYQLEINVLIKIFGYAFIVMRFFGLTERLLLASVIYLIFLRALPAKYAALAAITSIAIFASNTTDVIYSYYQSCLLLGLISVYIILIYFSHALAKNETTRFDWLVVIAGIAGGLSFLTKQTTGLFVPLVILVISFIIMAKTSLAKAWRNTCLYLVGFFAPVAYVFYWLHTKGVLSYYIQQVYLGSKGSKGGSLITILFGFLPRILTANCISSILLLAIAGWLLCYFMPKIASCNKLLPIENKLIIFSPRDKNISFLITLGLLTITGVYLIYFSPLFFKIINKIYVFLNFFHLKLFFIHILFFIVIVLFIHYLVKFYKTQSKDNNENIYFILISAVSFAVMYAHGLSYSIEEHSVVPAFGLLFSYLILLNHPFAKIKNLIISLVCLSVIYLCAVQRISWPYEWWGWKEPDIRTANTIPTLPLLKGFRLSENTNKIITEITNFITTHSSKNDSIYTFPHIPLFYILSDRYPNTYALIHYFDVCPDSAAETDAKTLEKSPPKIIIWMEFPEDVWKFHENTFRQGHQSGQRKLQSLINKFITSKMYSVEKTYLTPTGYKLKILLKTV